MSIIVNLLFVGINLYYAIDRYKAKEYRMAAFMSAGVGFNLAMALVSIANRIF